MSSPRIREHKITNSLTSLPQRMGASSDFPSEGSILTAGTDCRIRAVFRASPAMG